MALESLTGSAVFIDSLVVTNPLITDQKLQGDDHIRGIKQTLRNTFRNVAASVNASAGELNALVGATVSAGELNVLSGVQALTKNQLVYMPSGAAAFAGLSVGAALSVNASAGTVDLDIAKASATASLDSSDEFVLVDISDGEIKRAPLKTMLAAGQDLVYISTQSTAATATYITFTNMTSAYRFYRYVFENVLPTETSATFYLDLALTTANFATEQNYVFFKSTGSAGGGAVTADEEHSAANMHLGDRWANVTGSGVGGTLTAYNHADSTFFPMCNWELGGVGETGAGVGSSPRRCAGFGHVASATSFVGMRYSFKGAGGSSGAILSGKIHQYGLKTS